MIPRAVIHVDGPVGGGKTRFIERLLAADIGSAICVRGRQDPTVRRVRESEPTRDKELRRYHEAGALAAALYRFAAPDIEAFYESDVLLEPARLIIIEGDLPMHRPDLSIFVAPPLPEGKPLLLRAMRSRTDRERAMLDHLTRSLGGASHLSRVFGGALFMGGTLPPEVVGAIGREVEATRRKKGTASAPQLTEQWVLADGYEGLAQAQLVVINVRSAGDRITADTLVAEIPRLRKDPDVFRDVIGFAGDRRAITAVVANLEDPRDPGVKKAVARVRRVQT